MVRKRLNTILVPIIAASFMGGCRSSHTQQFWPFASHERSIAHSHAGAFGHGATIYDGAPTAPSIASPDAQYGQTENGRSANGVEKQATVPQVPVAVEPPKPQSLANVPREIPKAPPMSTAPPSDAEPWWGKNTESTENAIAALEALGAVVDLDEDGNPVAVNLAETDFGDNDARLLRGLTSLHRLDLTGTDVTEASLANLPSLVQLQMLLLNHTSVSDAGLKHLESLTQLQFLGLTHTPITNSGLVHLQALTKLEYLLLSHTHVTVAGLSHLQGLKRLQGLSLVGTRISDDELAEMKQALPNCRFLTASPQHPENLPAPPPEIQAPADVTSPKPEVEGDRAPFDPSERPDAPRALEHGPTFQIPPAPEAEGPSLKNLGPGLPVEREHAAIPDTGAPLRDAVRQVGDDVPALQRMANDYGSARRWHDAVTVLQAARRKAPKDATVQYNLAVALAHSGEINTARPHFVATVGEAAADYNLGLVLYEQGRLRESGERFAAALRRQPNFPAAQTWLNAVHKEEQAVKNLTAMKVLTDESHRPEAVKRVAATQQASALLR